MFRGEHILGYWEMGSYFREKMAHVLCTGIPERKWYNSAIENKGERFMLEMRKIEII